jgi:hypothetical protein
MGKEKNLKNLNDLFDKTIDSNIRFNGNLNNIDYFSAICKATTNDLMIKFQGTNLSMFNYTFNNEDSILMIFSLPSNDNSEKKQNKKKHITERIMGIIKILEENFITLDYTDCKNIKDEKFVHLTVIKKIDKNKKQMEEN